MLGVPSRITVPVPVSYGTVCWRWPRNKTSPTQNNLYRKRQHSRNIGNQEKRTSRPSVSIQPKSASRTWHLQLNYTTQRRNNFGRMLSTPRRRQGRHVHGYFCDAMDWHATHHILIRAKEWYPCCPTPTLRPFTVSGVTGAAPMSSLCMLFIITYRFSECYQFSALQSQTRTASYSRSNLASKRGIWRKQHCVRLRTVLYNFVLTGAIAAKPGLCLWARRVVVSTVLESIKW